jgi:hypothetical protein
MTRKEALALYSSIRADMNRHLEAAQKLATREELLSNAEVLGLLHDGTIVADDQGIAMLADTSVFLPNDAYTRVIDRYLAGLTEPREQAFVRRMSKAMLSVWEVIGKHALGGVVVDDALGRRKRRHLMDQGLARSTRKGDLLGLRLFDAGPFACAFGIVVPVPHIDAMLLRAGSLPPPILHITLYASFLHGMSAAELLLGLAEAESAAA